MCTGGGTLFPAKCSGSTICKIFSLANHSLPSFDLEISGRKFVSPGCAPSKASSLVEATLTAGSCCQRCSSDEATITRPHCVSSQREPWLSLISEYISSQGSPLCESMDLLFPVFPERHAFCGCGPDRSVGFRQQIANRWLWRPAAGQNFDLAPPIARQIAVPERQPDAFFRIGRHRHDAGNAVPAGFLPAPRSLECDKEEAGSQPPKYFGRCLRRSKPPPQAAGRRTGSPHEIVRDHRLSVHCRFQPTGAPGCLQIKK